MFNSEKISANSKQEFYRLLNAQLEALLSDETDWLANLANAAALLYAELSDINWAGFYLWKGAELVLGPFQGKPACVRIPMGKGVCGTAAQRKATVVVPDVHQFPGHIACDSLSRAEIVTPWIQDGQLLGVIDIDSPLPNRFDDEDAAGIERFVATLNKHITPHSIR